MAKISINDIAVVIFFSLIGAVLICVGMFIFASALFSAVWGYAFLETLILGIAFFLILGIPFFLFGLFCVVTAVRTARQASGRRVINVDRHN